jgi:hypothetical protein
VPPERALVETDTPYLAPPPHRGQPNEPAWVALVGAALARVWGIDVQQVAEMTTANAARVFLPPKGGVPPEAGRGIFSPLPGEETGGGGGSPR